MKKIIYPILVLLLVLMTYFGMRSYEYAVDYERYTAELASHQGVQEQAERKFYKLAKSILGALYEDANESIFLDTKTQQQDAKEQAKYMMYYFMLALLFLLLSYFFIPLRNFTIFSSFAAIITLVFGLFSPILMVTIHKEVEYLGDIILSFESKGIVGSIIKLWDSGDIVISFVILLFSVIVPIVKILSLLFVSIFAKSKFTHSVVKFFKMIGKWSMLDVFVVAVFLVYLTGNKGDVSRAEVEVGLYFFLAYVIVSMLVSLSADKILHKSKV